MSRPSSNLAAPSDLENVQTEVMTGRQALTMVLDQELRRSPAVLVIGETVRDGGAAGVTSGLYDRFGAGRVLETPVSENAIVGCALGLALEGFIPVVEIYSADFLFVVANEIINDIAKWRQQQRLDRPLPVILRACMGANGGLGPEHSQSMEPYLHHAPGLTVITPGAPRDLAGLLRSSIRGVDPVVFLEHRRLYDTRGTVPTDPDFTIPIGPATMVRRGDAATVVAWGWMRQEAERAALRLADRGVAIELIDPGTIRPFDFATVIDSARQTRNLYVVEESPITGSVAAELLARVVEAGVTLDRGMRVAMPDAIHPYSARMESLLLPTAERIYEAVLHGQQLR